MRAAVFQEVLDNGVRLDKLRAIGVQRPPDAGRFEKELRRPAEAIPEISRAGVCLTGLGGRKTLHRDENGAPGRLYFQLHAIARRTGWDLGHCLQRLIEQYRSEERRVGKECR